MRKTGLCLLLALTTIYLSAQTYQPVWESLDKRPVPQWFNDGKFGIFIHWGVYSVPAWVQKGSYAEWYQNALSNTSSKTYAYHHSTYGDMSYYSFADQFKAELFDPVEWAKLFEASGAKYIVLTSKHHDGFCLWPSKESNRDWGFPWNAMDVGPKRDLIGDLFKAVRKTSVHAGLYYSLYEWYNPLWKKDPANYAIQHAWPQMKDLINTYQPDVLWTDGDWEASPDVWKSQEFLAWLYNQSPVKDKIVVNDRWGSGVRFHHAGIYTPEYQPELDFEDHAWEESRGMGYSYGYNREEDAWDYNSAQSLIYHLLDKVSRGGNFLLDIGPDSHGKIPPIMQERLLQIGAWLKVNGEAIYNTTRWKRDCQWTEGKKDYKAKKGEDIMMKLTVDPEPGYATKEVFYTYNATTNSLYAIFPKYPSNKRIVLKNMPIAPTGDITLLTTGDPLTYRYIGNDITIQLPEYGPPVTGSANAYVIKISNYGAFVKKPVINVAYDPETLQATVSMESKDKSAVINYEDGDILNPYVLLMTYTKPFSVNVIDGNHNRIIAYAKKQGFLPSDPAEVTIHSYPKMEAVEARALQNGLKYRYFEDDKLNLAALSKLKPVKQGVSDKVSVSVKQRKDKYGLIFDGYIKIEKTGGYSFYTESDDGSVLYIDDKLIVNNDGDHGMVEEEGKCLLEKGFHRISVEYFDSGGENNLKISYNKLGETKTEVPSSILFHSTITSAQK